FAIDQDLAARGETLFNKTCARCHGTYAPTLTRSVSTPTRSASEEQKNTYPNLLVPIEEVGTDRVRLDALSREHREGYGASWFAEFGKQAVIAEPGGYVAPPLDGIWATAPYFHNGSVPTLAGVLNSKARPNRFTRSFKTDEADYDKVKVGWKVTELTDPPAPNVPAIERRKIYDTSKPGRA